MAQTPQIRTCPVCSKQFTAYVWNKRYCSDECYFKAHALGLKGNRCGHSPRFTDNLAVKTRKCHDCGRPTNDYRCEYCWCKRRGISHKTVNRRGNDMMDSTRPYFFSL